MSVKCRIVLNSDTLNNFDIYYTVSSASALSRAEYTQLYNSKSISNDSTDLDRNIYVAIAPKNNNVLKTNNYSFSIPYGYSDSTYSSIADYQATALLAESAFTADYHSISYNYHISLIPSTIQVSDGYGGYETVSAYVSNLCHAFGSGIYIVDFTVRDLKLTLTHCSLQCVEDSRIIYDQTITYKVLNGQDLGNIQIIPDEGYSFETSPTYQLPDVNGGYSVISATPVTNTIYQFAQFITVYTGSSMTFTEINFSADVITPITEEFPFIQIYTPTNKELTDLGKVRFIRTTPDGTEFIDLGDYILDVFRLYINIPSGMDQNIKLSKYDTGVNSKVALEQKVETLCGMIHINEYYNNAVDYTESKLNAYLPFYGMVSLEPAKYIDRDIYLKYITDVITGDTTIYFYIPETIDNSIIDRIIDQYTCNISFKIPYKIKTPTTEISSEIKTNSKMLLSKIPYIEQSLPIEYHGDSGNVIYKVDQISDMDINDFNGRLLKFSDVQLNFNASMSEKDEIVSLLERGIYINE